MRRSTGWRTSATGEAATALHKAAQRGRKEVCEWLIGPEVRLSGAAHFAPNRAEQSRPCDLARFAGHEELARWLAALPEARAQGVGQRP